jgi:hypothetical protein
VDIGHGLLLPRAAGVISWSRSSGCEYRGYRLIAMAISAGLTALGGHSMLSLTFHRSPYRGLDKRSYFNDLFCALGVSTIRGLRRNGIADVPEALRMTIAIPGYISCSMALWSLRSFSSSSRPGSVKITAREPGPKNRLMLAADGREHETNDWWA